MSVHFDACGIVTTYSSKNDDVLGITDDESSQACTKGSAVEDAEMFLGYKRKRGRVCERQGFGSGVYCRGRGDRRVGEG